MNPLRHSKRQITLRTDVCPADRQAVEEMVKSTEFFSAAEVGIAVELIDDRLAKGGASDYHFVFCDLDGQTVGYACYGLIACTVHSFDVYWIAVHRDFQRQSLGQLLMDASEERIAQMDGRRIYVETSGRSQYESTRRFYERCGYDVEAVFRDFYDVGDDKVVYVKVLDSQSAPPRFGGPARPVS